MEKRHEKRRLVNADKVVVSRSSGVDLQRQFPRVPKSSHPLSERGSLTEGLSHSPGILQGRSILPCYFLP